MMLNDEQKKVVYADDRFLFLLAGAGSGKTRVIVERIKWLLSEGVHKDDILAITFTRKASFEMKERLNQKDLHIHTFHQFCYIRLKEITHKEINILKDDFLGFKKEDLLSISVYKNSYYKTKKPKHYDRYQAYLKDANLYDFDDLILSYDAYLKKHHDITYKYIFVDEFQDTNIIQYELLKKLIKNDTHVLAVGDPDQSIYQFRGADHQIIGKFIKDYQAIQYQLTLNYRSNETIITHANRLIKRNERLYKKDLIATKNTKKQVYHLVFSDTEKEAMFIIQRIIDYIKQDIKPKSIAVLFRQHKRAYQLKIMLHEQHIDFQDGFLSSYESSGIELLTIHQAKGLEFDVVFMIGLEQGEFPSYQQRTFQAIEEERRLMFVGITRAKDFLYLTSVKMSHQNHTFTHSQFIEESGVKTVSERWFNDIISLGDFDEHQTKNR